MIVADVHKRGIGAPAQEKKVNVRTVLFFVFLIIISIGKGADLPVDNVWFKGLVILGFVFGVASFFTAKNLSKNDIFIALCVAFCGLVSLVANGKEGFFITAATITFMYGFDVTSAIKTVFFGRLIGFVTVVVLMIAGFVTNATFIYWREGAVTRYDLGFGHPNSAHMAFCILVLLFMYLYFNRLNLLKCLLLFAANYWLYTFTGSRGGYYVCAFAIVLFYIGKRTRHSQSMLSTIAVCIVPAVLCFSFGMVALYNKGIPFIATLNLLMTGRLRIAHAVFNKYGITLFGVKEIYTNSVTIDDGYVFTLLQYGLVPFVLLVLSMFALALRAKRDKDVKTSLLILVLMVYTLNESFFPNILFNFALFLIPSVIYQKNRALSETTVVDSCLKTKTEKQMLTKGRAYGNGNLLYRSGYRL